MNNRFLTFIVGIFATLFFIVYLNVWFGNPYSKVVALASINEHISKNYDDMEVSYDFYDYSNSMHNFNVKQIDSKDITFSVTTDLNGNVLYDDYFFMVENNYTTYERLENEFSFVVENLLSNNLIGGTNYEFINFDTNFIFYNNVLDDIKKLEKDVSINMKNTPFPINMKIDIYVDDISFENAFLIAKNIDDYLKKIDIIIYNYDIKLVSKNLLSKNVENYFNTSKIFLKDVEN